MTGRYHKQRRIISAVLLALLAGIPFLRINGQSALRFDIPTLRLFFFGSEIWIADFFLVLVAVIFLTFFTLVITTLFGRIWCGWFCPQTVLMDAADIMKPRPASARGMRFAAEAGLVLASAAIAFSLMGYFISPWDIPSVLARRDAGATIVAVVWSSMTVLLFLDARLLGRKFCATVCPYAKMQGVLFDARTLRIAYDPARQAECMGCEACIRSCPVHIDIRQGLQTACIHCAECIDACTGRMGTRGRKSLINYSWGEPGTKPGGIRINPIITGALAALSLMFFLYLSATRMPFDMTVRLVYPGTDRQSADRPGVLYDLSFRNMTEKDIPVDLSVRATGESASIEPGTVLVRKGADLTRIRALVSLNTVTTGRTDSFILTARSLNKSISIKVYSLKSGSM